MKKHTPRIVAVAFAILIVAPPILAGIITALLGGDGDWISGMTLMAAISSTMTALGIWTFYAEDWLKAQHRHG